MDMRFLRSVGIAAAAAAAAFSMGIIDAGAQGMPKLEARVNAAVAKIQAACGDDLKKYCSTVTPGEGRIMLCIQAHEDKISTKCDYALFEAARNLERALDRIEMTADVCWGDIEKNCAGLPAGQGNILKCLATKKASVSAACQAEIGKFEAAK